MMPTMSEASSPSRRAMTKVVSTWFSCPAVRGPERLRTP
jgi:hypothetical protein